MTNLTRERARIEQLVARTIFGYTPDKIVVRLLKHELAKERARVRRIVRKKYPSFDIDDYHRGYSKALTDILAALKKGTR